MTCIVTAGYCPKPENTYGEPHYCEREDWHQGPHVCRCCGMEFNALANCIPEVAERQRVAGSEPPTEESA